jgi:hypothetical protein
METTCNAHPLISFSKPHKIMAFSLLALFFVLVGLGIHQYSLPLWSYTCLEKYQSNGVLIGIPQPIRSDDWAVEIPLMLSQVSHKPPFPVVNTNIGYGANLLAPFKVPIWHILTIFKPTTWGFFFGMDAGLAWMWWSMVLGLFYSFFLLFMLISGNRFLLSVLASLLLVFSPFFQFWSMHKSEIPIFMALIFVSSAYLLFSKDKKVILASGFLLGWFCGCYILNFIYPPFQVSLAYLLVFMGVGFIASRYYELNLRQAGQFRLAGLAAFITITVFAAAVFFFQTREIIGILAETVYPGKRFSTGGDFDSWKLLSNTFLIHLYAFVKHGVLAASLVRWADMSNICESASFIFLFPFLLPIVIAECVIRKRAVDPLSLMVGGYLILILGYMFLRFPDWLSKYTGFCRTPAFRELLGLGIANMILLVIMLSRPAYFDLPGKIRIALASAWALALVLSAIHLYAKWPLVPLPYLITASLAVALLSYFLFCARYSKAMLISLVALSVLSTAWFNPLVIGGSKIFSESDLCRKIIEIDSEYYGESQWVVFSGASPAIPNLFRILSVKALNGTHPYPQFDFWKKLDPDRRAIEVYNRYGYVMLQADNSPDIGFSVRTNDSFRVIVNPETDVLGYLGATHCMVTGIDTGIFDRSPALKRIFSFRNSAIYEVMGPVIGSPAE